MSHPFFGRITFMFGEYWEGELLIPSQSERIGVTLPASETGPSEGQVQLCRRLLGDLDALFNRCRPVFEGAFEEWAGQPFPDDWREAFLLVGLGLPPEGDESRPWEVWYFVDAANHYFTSHFEHGAPSFLTVDG